MREWLAYPEVHAGLAPLLAGLAAALIRYPVRLAAAGICALLLLEGCASRIAPVEPDPSEPATAIWVIRHGWHSGIALARADIAPGRWPEAAHFPRAVYLEAGWGDRDFYMAPGFNAWYGIKALFWPTASVVHLVGFDAHPQRAFPSSEVVELRVSRRGLEGLIAFLEAGFERQGKSEAAPLARGLYGVDSAFYPSPEKFHLFNMCNTWTARALRAAGTTIESAATTEASAAAASAPR